MSRRRKPFPSDPVIVTITGLTHDGRGISRYEEKILFVLGALPGEKVRVKYTRAYNRYSEGIALEVLESPSKERAPAPCPYFGLCGGCQIQHLAPDAQIMHKQALLQEQLTQANVFPEQWLPPLVGPMTGYRQKARLAVRYVDKKETLLVGFREQKNSKIAIIDACHTLDARVGLKIGALRDCIDTLENKRAIAQIEVAIGGEQVALVFRHVTPLSTNDVTVLRDFCKTEDFSLYLQPQGAESVHKVSPDNGMLLRYTLPTQQLVYDFHPLDFIQVNQEMNQKMVNQALALLQLTSSDTVLDLFCGLGNFTLPLAQTAKQVVGVEGSEAMVARAEHNARTNQLQNVKFFMADLSAPLVNQHWTQSSYSVVVLDPSRLGAKEIIENIRLFGAKKILYVSCNSATFTRDAALLTQMSYRLTQIGVMDMFPQTAHLEVMGLFEAW